MDDRDRLARQFEDRRGHLRAVAFRMLGSLAEAEDAVQETWLRLDRADVGDVANLTGWLTTVTSRLCLDRLRSRAGRREEPLDGAAGTTVVALDDADPAAEAELADSVGLALMVVLDALAPAERIAFVLHDLFGVPFDEIAPVVARSTDATKKLASRARRRLRGLAEVDGADIARQRPVVDAFLAAVRTGDLGALLAVLDPDVVRHADAEVRPAGAPAELRGARAVAAEAPASAVRAQHARPALVDGAVGLVVAPAGRLRLALRLAVDAGRITAIDVVAAPDRLRRLDLGVLDLGVLDPGVLDLGGDAPPAVSAPARAPRPPAARPGSARGGRPAR